LLLLLLVVTSSSVLAIGYNCIYFIDPRTN
jgi:hypothetical protein